MKSAKTEFIKEDREKMRDPEPCRIKHTEDTEQQTGCCLFFIHLLIVLMVIKLQVVVDCLCCNWKDL